MKKWVWTCRVMYVLLASCIVGVFVLKDTQLMYALAITAFGSCIILPLTVVSVVECNRSRRARREALRATRKSVPVVTTVQPSAALSMFQWRTEPEELNGQPRWGDHSRLVHVVDGVAAFGAPTRTS